MTLSQRRPGVSVVVACRHDDDALKKTLFSVAAQEAVDTEIIIVDPGGSETRAGLLRAFQSWRPGIRVLSHDAPAPPALRNVGAEAAGKETITFVDAGDLLFKNALADRLDRLGLGVDPGLVGAVCPSLPVDVSGHLLAEAPRSDARLNGDRIMRFSRFVNPMALASAVIRTDRFRETGGFDPAFGTAGEFELWHRLLADGGYFAVAPRCRVGVRHDPEAFERTDLEGHFLRYRTVQERLIAAAAGTDAAASSGTDRARTCLFFGAAAAFAGEAALSEEMCREIPAEDIGAMSAAAVAATLEDAVLWQCCRPDDAWAAEVGPAAAARLDPFIDHLIARFSGSIPAKAAIVQALGRSAGPRGVTVAYLPGFQESAKLADQYHRMLWYLHPIVDTVSAIHIPLCFEPAAVLETPPYFDPAIRELAPRFDGKVVFFSDRDAAKWRVVAETADLFLSWRRGVHHPVPAVDAILNAPSVSNRTKHVDPEGDRDEGAIYLSLSNALDPELKAHIDDSKEKLQALIRRLGRAERAYIFGTGPSLSAAMQRDFSDGVAFACNSMVKNDALMDHIDARVIAAADPIFHAGASSYAGAFRRHLVRAMDARERYLVVPLRDLRLYLENLPARLADRIIGVPLEPLDQVNLDLSRHFGVRNTANILTLFLIPIACTVATEIRVMGCDGRRLSEDDYYWKHDESAQLTEEMAAIRRAHPAFFDINYNEYYLEHCETLEQWIGAAEQLGKRFVNLTPSHIPALIRRTPRIDAPVEESQAAALGPH